MQQLAKIPTLKFQQVAEDKETSEFHQIWKLYLEKTKKKKKGVILSIYMGKPRQYLYTPLCNKLTEALEFSKTFEDRL